MLYSAKHPVKIHLCHIITAQFGDCKRHPFLGPRDHFYCCEFIIFYNYRPQRSCEGYVFTGVCLSTGRMPGPWVSVPGGVPGTGGECLFPGGVWSGGWCLVWRGLVPAGICSGGLLRRESALGGLLRGGGIPACT